MLNESAQLAMSPRPGKHGLGCSQGLGSFLTPMARWFCGCSLFFSLHLLNGFEWQQATGYRRAELPVPKIGKTGFTQLRPEQTGISFTNRLSDEKAAENQIRL